MRQVDHQLYQEYTAQNFCEDFMQAFREWYDSGGVRPLHPDSERAIRIVQSKVNSGALIKDISKGVGVPVQDVSDMYNRNTTEISLESARRIIQTYTD